MKTCNHTRTHRDTYPESEKIPVAERIVLIREWAFVAMEATYVRRPHWPTRASYIARRLVTVMMDIMLQTYTLDDLL
jgi:hypothetical protein